MKGRRGREEGEREWLCVMQAKIRTSLQSQDNVSQPPIDEILILGQGFHQVRGSRIFAHNLLILRFALGRNQRKEKENLK